MSKTATADLLPYRRAVLDAIKEACEAGDVLECGRPDTRILAERLDITMGSVRTRAGTLADRGLLDRSKNVREGTVVQTYGLTEAGEEVLADAE